MRCSACFADCGGPRDSISCVVCQLSFHIKCTSWKALEYQAVCLLKHGWHCIFCRKNQIKRVLFLVDDNAVGIRQLDTVKRTARLSTKNFERKMWHCKKSNLVSTFLLDDMVRSLGHLKTSVGTLSDYNSRCDSDNVKLQRIIGDMSNKLENLCFI